MTLTLRDVPREVDDALQRTARTQGRSVDEVVMDFIRAGLAGAVAVRRRDLSGFAGTWVSDPAVEAALQDQDRVDPEMWR